MELTEIKAVWKEWESEWESDFHFKENDIREMIRKESAVLINKITRELRYKRWLMGSIGVLTMLSSGAYLLDFDENYLLADVFNRLEMAELMFGMGAVIFLLFLNILRTYRKMKAFQRSAPNVKEALLEAEVLLKRIQRLATLVDCSTVPLVVGWYTFNRLNLRETFAWDNRIVYLLMAMGISFFLIYHLSRLVQRRKFGGYVERLREQINDLETLDK